MTRLVDREQFKSGKEVEFWLDVFFRERGWEIKPTSRHEERDLCLGDRHYTKQGDHYFVEYKSGIQTFYTGNVFLETISVDTESKPGWVYTCRADFIFYAALLNKEILVIRPSSLRKQINNLKTQFKVTKTSKGQNETYNTHGVIVPLWYAEKNLVAKIVPTEQE